MNLNLIDSRSAGYAGNKLQENELYLQGFLKDESTFASLEAHIFFVLSYYALSMSCRMFAKPLYNVFWLCNDAMFMAAS